MQSGIGAASERSSASTLSAGANAVPGTNGHFAGGTHAPAALAWYGLGVLLMTTLFALVVRQMISLIAPSLQTSMGISDLQIGMLQGLGIAIFACVASYPMGWLADQFGRRLILAIGVAIWSLATVFCAFQHSFGGLFAATIGIAIGEAGLLPIAYAMIPDLFTERRRNMANLIFYAGFMFGAGMGMALGGALLEWLDGSAAGLPMWLAGIDSWRIAMVMIALPGPLFLLLIGTIPLAQRTRPPPQTHNDDARPGGLDALTYVKAHGQTLACIFGSIFTMAVAMTSSLTWFPLALPRAFGISPAAVGIGLGTAVTIATLIGILLPGIGLRLGKSAGRLAPIKVACFFVWLTPLPAALLPFTTSPFQAYIVAALQGAMGIAGSALMPGIIQGLAPSQLRSRVLAVYGIVNALALAASPLAVGLVSALIVGPRGVLYSLTVVNLPFLLAAAILLSLAQRPYAGTMRALQSPHSREAA